jgi:hypothetical protein
MSFVSTIRKARDEMRTRQSDPWFIRITAARGKIGDDGVERIATHTLFDILEIPQRARTAAAGRRLAEIMRGLGWSPIRARGLTPTGLKDQVRGYARDKTAWSEMA